MTLKEYLRSKGYTPEAIVCNDWNQTLSAFDIEEMLEDYHQTKLKNNEVLDLVSDCFTPNSVERAYFDGRNDSCDMFHIDNYR